jgi:hypothetical protein
MKKIFIRFIICALCVTSSTGFAQGTATADVTETFAAEYMPATKAHLETLRQIRTADSKLFHELREAGRLMETDDEKDYYSYKIDAINLLAGKIVSFMSREELIIETLKDLYFKHMAELVEADDLAMHDTKIAKEGNVWLADRKDCRTIFEKREEKPDLEAEYLVFDLLTHIKSSLPAPPAEGWSKWHKTDALVLRKVGNFWIGIFEVTQKQWQNIMGKNPSHFSSSPDSPQRPVEEVSWNDAIKFCQVLSGQSRITPDLLFTLPMESQWELAARGGANHEYSGSNNLDEVGWYGSNSGNQTHVVGTKKPNGYGIYDMSGNVWEWCLDKTFGRRAFRGGSWYYYASYCSVSYRFANDPDFRSNYLGFRVVLVPSSSE